MTNQVKVPKEIQELFFEAEAFNKLTVASRRWILPSPKAFYYALRAAKVESLAWRTLMQMAPQVAVGAWSYVPATGLAMRTDEPTPTPKAPRAPRKAKVKAEVKESV